MTRRRLPLWLGYYSNPHVRTICSWCKRVTRDGPLDPDGRVSHGICYDCAVEHAEDYGITDEDLEAIRVEQGIVARAGQKNPAAVPGHLDELHAFAVAHRQQIDSLLGVSVELETPLGAGTSALAYPAGDDVAKLTFDCTEAQAARTILADVDLNTHPGVLRIYGVWTLGASLGKRGPREIHLLHVERLLPFESVVKKKRDRRWIEAVLTEYRETLEYVPDAAEDQVDTLSGDSYMSEVADFLRLVHERTGMWPEDVYEGNLGGRLDGGLALLDLGATHLAPVKANPGESPQIPTKGLHHAFPLWLPPFIANRWERLNFVYGELDPVPIGLGGFGVAFVTRDGQTVVKITSDADEANVVARLVDVPELASHPGVVRVYSVSELPGGDGVHRAWAIHEERLKPLITLDAVEVLPGERRRDKQARARRDKLFDLVKKYRLAADAGELSWLAGLYGREKAEQKYQATLTIAFSDLRQHKSTAQLADFLQRFYETFGVPLQDVHLDNLARRKARGPLVVFDLGFTRLP